MSCNLFRLFAYVIVSHHPNLSKTGKHWGSFLTHCSVHLTAAYLNSVLNEEIYLKLPAGFKLSNTKVWQLGKSIYGTKQGRHIWYECIKEEFEALGYICSNTDHSIFLKYDESGMLICIVAIY